AFFRRTRVRCERTIAGRSMFSLRRPENCGRIDGVTGGNSKRPASHSSIFSLPAFAFHWSEKSADAPTCRSQNAKCPVPARGWTLVFLRADHGVIVFGLAPFERAAGSMLFARLFNGAVVHSRGCERIARFVIDCAVRGR